MAHPAAGGGVWGPVLADRHPAPPLPMRNGVQVPSYPERSRHDQSGVPHQWACRGGGDQGQVSKGADGSPGAATQGTPCTRRGECAAEGADHLLTANRSGRQCPPDNHDRHFPRRSREPDFNPRESWPFFMGRRPNAADLTRPGQRRSAVRTSRAAEGRCKCLLHARRTRSPTDGWEMPAPCCRSWGGRASNAISARPRRRRAVGVPAGSGSEARRSA